MTLPLLAAGQRAGAAEWTFSESLFLSETYTDNVSLVEEDPESAWVTIITPTVFLEGKGRRMDLSFVGGFQFVSEADETFYPTFRAMADVEAIKKHFFVNAHASADQRTIDPLRPAGDIINRTDNITTTYSVGINPYFVGNLKDFAKLRIDYAYEYETFSGGSLDDRDFNDFTVRLNSGSRFVRYFWDFLADYSRTDYDDEVSSNTVFKTLDLRIGTSLTSSISPYAAIGHEWNTYRARPVDYETGGNTWRVGMEWNPNPRILLDVGYGYRFFGHYPFVKFSYRHRRSVLQLRYIEDLESRYLPLGQQSLLATEDLAGNPVDPFGGGSFDVNRFDNLTQTGAFINKRFNADYQLQGRRTILKLRGEYSHKYYLAAPTDILEWRIWAIAQRQVYRNLSVNGWVRWYRTEDQTDFKADTFDIQLGTTRNFGEFTSVTLAYVHSRRDSNRPLDDYTENRISLVLRTTLLGLAGKAGL